MDIGKQASTTLIPLAQIRLNEGQLDGLPANPRQILDHKFEKLKADIQAYPELLELRGLLIYPMGGNEYITIGGNMRLRAMQDLGFKEAPCIVIPKDTPVEKLKAYTILDNGDFGKWNWDALANEWDAEQLEEWGVDTPLAFDVDDEPESDASKEGEQEEAPSLEDRFIIPPFSILNTRVGAWQKRKKAWRAIIGDLGESREDKMRMGIELKYHTIFKKSMAEREKLGVSFREYLDKYVSEEEKERAAEKATAKGVSLFDPVVAELMGRWFIPHEGGEVIDCFAGDTQKGLVFGMCGYKFSGIELREEQVEVNNRVLAGRNVPVNYICDDGRNVDKYFEEQSKDFLFSCPPYYNLEVYSSLSNDASNQKSYADFLEILSEAFGKAIKCLKDNRFACIVIGDVRDKNGFYYDFISDVKGIFKRNGMSLYNELIIVETVASSCLRANNNMKTRKITKVHQNILVFFKGDPSNIKSEFPQLDYTEADFRMFEEEQAEEL